MFVKQYVPKSVFVTDVLYNWISQFKISCTNVWRRNLFSKLFLKTMLAHLTLVTLTSDSKIKRVPLLPRMDVWTKFELLIGNGFGIFNPGDLWPSDPKIIRVPPLSRMDVCTKFEKDRSTHSRVIDWKGKGYRRTYWPTCSKQYFFVGEHNKCKHMAVK